jgi:hypothetical protein
VVCNNVKVKTRMSVCATAVCSTRIPAQITFDCLPITTKTDSRLRPVFHSSVMRDPCPCPRFFTHQRYRRVNSIPPCPFYVADTYTDAERIRRYGIYPPISLVMKNRGHGSLITHHISKRVFDLQISGRVNGLQSLISPLVVESF